MVSCPRDTEEDDRERRGTRFVKYAVLCIYDLFVDFYLRS